MTFIVRTKQDKVEDSYHITNVKRARDSKVQ